MHGYIAAGGIYQISLTFPLTATANTCSESLYAALAEMQPVRHGALVLQDGLPNILSRAPELFLCTNAQGLIQTHPMTGTQPQHREPAQNHTNLDLHAIDPKN